MHTIAPFAMSRTIFRLIWKVTFADVRMTFIYRHKTTSATVVKVRSRTARVAELRLTGSSVTSVPRVMVLVVIRWNAYPVQ